MKDKNLRSPFFYVGDKYKLMPQLIEMFPDKINNYYEPFVGGGSSVLYTEANKYFLNDIDPNVIRLHEYISSFCESGETLFNILKETIKKYNFSCSYLGINVPDEFKKIYKKTYYAKFNRDAYLKMRENFNNSGHVHELYLLLIYGFNRMIRFNSKGEFNIPVGNVDFNKNVVDSLTNYIDFAKYNKIKFFCLDYLDFVNRIKFRTDDFVYFDPPYLITNSEYNKLWNEKDEVNLYKLLDELNDKNIRFGISNIVSHKGKYNIFLETWMSKYYVYEVKSNYISRFDNTVKEDSREVYITNHEKK